eukprot:365998-Chlamydomonas_euryale.AAC.9
MSCVHVTPHSSLTCREEPRIPDRTSVSALPLVSRPLRGSGAADPLQQQCASRCAGSTSQQPQLGSFTVRAACCGALSCPALEL